MFQLHERLAADTVQVCELALSQVRLMNDRGFPWLILIPARDGVREVYDLDAGERATLMEEMVQAEHVLQSMFKPDKLNLGALGNMVPQLHVHVVARFIYDRAWPGPVWGHGPAEPYAPAERSALVTRLRAAFGA